MHLDLLLKLLQDKALTFLSIPNASMLVLAGSDASSNQIHVCNFMLKELSHNFLIRAPLLTGSDASRCG